MNSNRSSDRFFWTLFCVGIGGQLVVIIGGVWIGLIYGAIIGFGYKVMYRWVTAPERDQEADPRGDRSDD